MDIAAWLRNLGLERYEPAFRENEIDWEVLPELTESDLEKLGLPLGPRKKLLKAIAGPSGKPTAVSTEVAPCPRPVAREDERRGLGACPPYTLLKEPRLAQERESSRRVVTVRAGLEVDTLTIRIPIRLQRRGGRKLIMMP